MGIIPGVSMSNMDRFSSPFDIETPPGGEGWKDLYSYHLLFSGGSSTVRREPVLVPRFDPLATHHYSVRCDLH